MKTPNVMNPEGIEAGDIVRLKSGNVPGELVVLSVGGKFDNKVYCDQIGHELYANCFELVRKGKAAK
jgi:hypothetical protein